ncbi:MAG: hypothetical protein ABI288_02295 [Ginsengibacter sp.]
MGNGFKPVLSGTKHHVLKVGLKVSLNGLLLKQITDDLLAIADLPE